MTVPIHDTLATLANAQRVRDAHAEARADTLRAKLPQVASMLRDEYGATGVWLFGSLAGGKPHMGSDVDLATQGLDHDRYFCALSVVDQLLGANVDLVQLERAPKGLVDRVHAEGVVL